MTKLKLYLKQAHTAFVQKCDLFELYRIIGLNAVQKAEIQCKTTFLYNIIFGMKMETILK